jgi:hypothetical protein
VRSAGTGDLQKVHSIRWEERKYQVLTFYGNWVVHSSLGDSPVAHRLVRYCDTLHYLPDEPELAELTNRL